MNGTGALFATGVQRGSLSSWFYDQYIESCVDGHHRAVVVEMAL
jgi:hypothetical protein